MHAKTPSQGFHYSTVFVFKKQVCGLAELSSVCSEDHKMKMCFEQCGQLLLFLSTMLIYVFSFIFFYSQFQENSALKHFSCHQIVSNFLETES